MPGCLAAHVFSLAGQQGSALSHIMHPCRSLMPSLKLSSVSSHQTTAAQCGSVFPSSIPVVHRLTFILKVLTYWYKHCNNVTKACVKHSSVQMYSFEREDGSEDV